MAVADILFLALIDHRPAIMKIYGQRTLSNMCNQVLGELMHANTAKISDSYFIKVTDTINSVDSKAISMRDNKRDLLNLAATMNNTIGNVIKGLANLLMKLPRLSVLNMSKIVEVELQSTYFDMFLPEIFADKDQQVALQWADKSVHQDLTEMRPDAIISTLVQHEFECLFGFSEAKRAIEWHDLPACLAFMINEYSISFFIVSKRHDCLYTMTEIASLDFASSLSNLHTFATCKNLDLLAAVSHCFWSICTHDLPNTATATILQERLDYLVPISNYMSLMAKSSKGTLGQLSQY
ncbi:hypothetical protein J3Q64DRAFT_1830416 [Phycomyces blakesleeanus]|uniref:Uncharacterized protein n=2 Tax=Phycomyces blakesleeanus TaxID=4837 RepID=A0A162UKV7_PHYB8|nr:hypothetical protein PHYBLDRAFT_142347 [Phycomyces blakesleeanus NRRL 1555(-)]OAD76842.1 hypothetical protein PHYBLDRAFT_142347 [Phycomyces blakesleeanus NRRL 1555(-)]|eukprot:XP_018294882.1 hypothetical protein PHYBLDRAFT_142347 [Phycomyces blakesleeanus NRRL 1555(-)]